MQTDSINSQEIIQATDECVMCGLCLPHCPTYNAAQIESESPRGRIALVRALYEEKITVNKTVHDHLHQCLSCMNCQHVCPANVDYEKIIDAGRAKTAIETTGIKSLQQSFILLILSNSILRRFFKILISASRSVGLLKLFSSTRLIRLLPNDRRTFSTTDSCTTGPKVVVIQSCANDLVSDPTNAAAISLLSKLGCKIVQQDKVYCCGALHQHSGKLETAKKIKYEFINAYRNKNFDFITTIATGCGAQIKHYGNELNSKVVDINELLLMRLKEVDVAFKPLAKKVFIHKPCTQKQVTAQADVIERLLANIPDVKLTDFHDQTGCCGAGGLNSILHTNLANSLIDNKVKELKISENSLLVSSNIGCAMHIQARLKQENIPVQVCHPVTLLAQQML